VNKQLAISIGAGLVSALLFVAAATGAVMSLMVLVLLTPLPIAITGFTYGWAGAAIASVIAAAFLTVIGSIKAGLFHLILFGGPATAAIYFLLLSRNVTDESGATHRQWYPVGRVLLGIAIASGLIATAALYSLGTSIADLETHVKTIVERMLDAEIPWPGGEKPTAEQLGDLTKLLTVSFSAAIALFWMWVMLFNLWIGAKIARGSGLLTRPWPNVSMIDLPPIAGIVLAVTVAASFLADYPGLIASGFASGLFVAFTLVGLAIVHNVTWINPLRPMILIAVYAFLLFFNPISGLAIASLALVEPLLPLRNPANGGRRPAPRSD
jgi:hypothetical protein